MSTSPQQALMPEGYRAVLRSIPVPQEDIDFFSSLAFTRPYLSRTSHYQPVAFLTRHKLRPDDTSDTFFSRVIKTHDTIPRMFAAMRKSDLHLPHSHRTKDVGTATSAENPSPAPQGPSDPYYVVFAQLESGTNGFPDTLHGGVVAALFDEALGLCVEGYREAVSTAKTWLYTASLEITYRAAVTTPGAVLIRTWIEKTEGRKWFVKGQLLDEDGAVKAEGKSLYISSKTRASL